MLQPTSVPVSMTERILDCQLRRRPLVGIDKEDPIRAKLGSRVERSVALPGPSVKGPLL